MADFTSSSTSPSGSHGAPVVSNQGGQVDVVQLLINKKLFLILGAVGGLALGFAGYKKLGPSYQAKSRILVSKTVTIPIQDDTTFRQVEGRTEHLALIMSPLVINRAIEIGDLGQIPSMREVPEDEVTQEILDALKVKRSAGQDRSFLNVIDLTYDNERPEDARQVLSAIILAYGEYLKESDAEHSNDQTDRIQIANQKLREELDAKEKEYNEFRDKVPLTYRTVPGLQGAVTTVTSEHHERVIGIEKERQKLVLEKAEVRSKIKALNEAIARGETPEHLEVMVRQFINIDGVSDPFGGLTPEEQRMEDMKRELDSHLLPLITKEQELARDYGKDNYDLQTVRGQIQTLIQFYRSRGVELPSGLPQSVRTPPPTREKVDVVQVYLVSLDQRLEALNLRHAELDELYQVENTKAKQYSGYITKEQTLSGELKRLRDLWAVVLNQRNKTEMVKQNASYRMKQIAPVVAEKSVKRPMKFMMAGMMFGVGMMAALLYFREWSDTSLRNIQEVRQRLSKPILGGVPAFIEVSPAQAAATGMDSRLIYYHKPGSQAAEALRAVRTALLATTATSQTKVLQITSPESGDGKSTFAGNLAIALAQSGKKVLLIDADLRRPVMGGLFGVRHDIGLTDILRGDIEWVNAIQETRVTGLSLITSGNLPANPAELLSWGGMQQVLSQAKAEFDLIIVDTAPLLMVTDPCIVAPHMDMTLLVLRLNKNRRAAALRAEELLDIHGVRQVGVVVNDIPTTAEEAYGEEERRPQRMPQSKVPEKNPRNLQPTV